MASELNLAAYPTEVLNTIAGVIRDRVEGPVLVVERFDAAAHILDALRSLPVEQRMTAMGMERSSYSGHRRSDGSFGRVHDKNSVHMDGCIPLYVEVDRG